MAQPESLAHDGRPTGQFQRLLEGNLALLTPVLSGCDIPQLTARSWGSIQTTAATISGKANEKNASIQLFCCMLKRS